MNVCDTLKSPTQPPAAPLRVWVDLVPSKKTEFLCCLLSLRPLPASASFFYACRKRKKLQHERMILWMQTSASLQQNLQVDAIYATLEGCVTFTPSPRHGKNIRGSIYEEGRAIFQFFRPYFASLEIHIMDEESMLDYLAIDLHGQYYCACHFVTICIFLVCRSPIAHWMSAAMVQDTGRIDHGRLCACGFLSIHLHFRRSSGSPSP